MTRLLRGVTWDHPRGYDPLARGGPLFTAKHPDYEIEWTRRSLRDFGVQPIEALAERFDILVIDHPFCGRAKATGCLLNLRPLFPAEFFAMLEGESVGPSTRSYEYGDGVWGLPTDAASQVASYRPDLLSALGFDGPPRSFAEVIELGAAARKSGKWLGLPGVQSDAACLVATLAANMGSPIPRSADHLLPTDVFETALDYLSQLRPLCHPESPNRNPIKTYDAMSSGDDIVYTPFAFGYTNYSRLGAKKPIRYTTIAGPGPDPVAGATLGAPAARFRPAAATSRPRSPTSLGSIRRNIRPAPISRMGGNPGSAPRGLTRRMTARQGASFPALCRRLIRPTSARASTALFPPSSIWANSSIATLLARAKPAPSYALRRRSTPAPAPRRRPDQRRF